ncbi:MAG: hypothetical protein JWN74_558 [Acidobacteriaceae bacterium]|nr:hypothetical protein [Acidobacteriaceae bacterium]
MIFLAKLGIGALGTALVGAAALSSEGFIYVNVLEHQPGGTHINVLVPAALVPATLRFVPNHHLAKASQQLRPYLPAIDAAIPALNDSPDGVLVEVADPGEHVLITKRDGSIVVDVNDAGETVHVSVPLRAAQSAIHQIAEANPAD